MGTTAVSMLGIATANSDKTTVTKRSDLAITTPTKRIEDFTPNFREGKVH
jgi:hypothetical protein